MPPITAPRRMTLDRFQRLLQTCGSGARASLEPLLHRYCPPALTQEHAALPPEHAALRDECRYDVQKFATEFFPHYCDDPFSEMHTDFFDVWANDHGTRGLRDVTAAPRGNAKTTHRVIIKTAHDCVYRHEKYILVVSSSFPLARDKVRDIRDELETNERLREVYGPQVGAMWNMHDFITSRGVRVRATGYRGNVRGLLWHAVRPSKILLDDAEDPEHVESEMQREKFVKWFMGDISKLGNRHTNIDVSGTILHPESLIAQLLKNPGYRHFFYQAVLQYAENWPLWEEWRNLYINLTNPDRVHDAYAFFEANRDDMMAGAEVLWPEHESYYELMVMRLVEGETAFQQEKLNNPIPEELHLFDMQRAGYFAVMPTHLVRRDGYTVPFINIEDLCAFYDPALGGDTGNPDWACCPVVGRDSAGYFYIIDAYIAHRDKPDEQISEIVDLLWRWQVPKIGVESNNFQTLLVSDLREAIAKRALEEGVDWSVEILQVRNLPGKSKPKRITTLEPMVTNKWLWFADNLHPEFYRQFAFFRPIKDAGKDDGPDATEGAVRVLKGMFHKDAPQ